MKPQPAVSEKEWGEMIAEHYRQNQEQRTENNKRRASGPTLAPGEKRNFKPWGGIFDHTPPEKL